MTIFNNMIEFRKNTGAMTMFPPGAPDTLSFKIASWALEVYYVQDQFDVTKLWAKYLIPTDKGLYWLPESTYQVLERAIASVPLLDRDSTAFTMQCHMKPGQLTSRYYTCTTDMGPVYPHFPTSTPKPVCVCPIRDLLSVGHNPRCPEKK